MKNSDDESLFGSSPPPSPSSTTLALPSGDICSEQNVGTLALPGLHNLSELPVSLVALPLAGNEPHPSLAQLPSDSPSASQCLQQRKPTTRTARNKKRSRENSTPPHATPIVLPPMDAPLPPNFLRNHQSLLGRAGMIGGINPAILSWQRHTLGRTAQNPIIVDDEHHTPSHKRTNESSPPEAINPAQLSPSSLAHLLSTLKNQGQIFPVLESIISHLASNPLSSHSATPPAQNTPPINDGPPPKRKKTGTVEITAGATDLDVSPPALSPKTKKSLPNQTTVSRHRREYILQMTKELRRQLVGEIGKSKVELWEMTIEHAVLVHLAKDDALT